jgi:hypothetical protein
MRHLCLIVALSLASPALALAPPCNGGVVFNDLNGNGRMDAGEPPLPGIAVSDGLRLVHTDERGRYALPVESGRTTFVIKPAGWSFARRDDGLPDFWRHVQEEPGPALRFGGISAGFPGCRSFALREDPRTEGELQALVFGDPQPKSSVQVGHYDRGIVDAVRARPSSFASHLGLTLGDVVHDDLSLYPAMIRATTKLPMPWLHVAGNHDLDFDAPADEDSLRSFRNAFGPDTFAWEEHEASFVLLDNVVYLPGQQPNYIGGLREDQFTFLESYLPTLPRDRLLVLGAHIPFFEPTPGRESFRPADRERLFALLKPFPKLLLLTAHGHVQRHHLHQSDTGWNGERPLHEYNVGAACGAFWSGVADARGVPDATMADGTPKGWAVLSVPRAGDYRLRWEVADDADHPGIRLHSPGVLRRGAYPAFGVFANVFMAMPDTRVEFRVAGGDWQPMQRVSRPDPWLMAENRRDDEASALRGFDRAPEAAPSTHLWRGALPTDLAAGEHRIEVRTQDRWRGELRAEAGYRLEEAAD